VPDPEKVSADGRSVAKLRWPPAGCASPAAVSVLVILSFHVIWHCDLRCLVEDSVVNETSAA